MVKGLNDEEVVHIASIKSWAFSLSVLIMMLAACVCALTYWFFDTQSSLLLPLNGMLTVLFVGITVYSIIYWKHNFRQYRYECLPFFINMATLLMVYISPPYLHNKDHHMGIIKLKSRFVNDSLHKLYLDRYMAPGAGEGNAYVEVFLTDKKNFSAYVTDYNPIEEIVEIQCMGDDVTVIKSRISGGYGISPSNPLAFGYYDFDLDKLITGHRFQ